MTTWEDNAATFAALDKGEGWPFARLIACSVQRGTGGPHLTGAIAPVSKVTARVFAEAAGTTHTRVLRYLDGWDRAAASGIVPLADTLTPEDAHMVPDPTERWETYYDASRAGGRPRDTKAGDAVAIMERRGVSAVVETMTPELRAEVAAHILAEPGVVEIVVDKALDAEPDLGRIVRERNLARRFPDKPALQSGPPRRRRKEPAPMDAIRQFRKGVDEMSDAVDTFATLGLASEDVQDVLLPAAARARAALDHLETILRHGGITDASLAAFLDGGAS